MEKKKLKLKKQTIVKLTDDEALRIKGGTWWLGPIFDMAQQLANDYQQYNEMDGGNEGGGGGCDGANTDMSCFVLYGGCNIGEVNVVAYR